MDNLKPKRLKLYNALQIGYLRDEKKQRKRLKAFGYRLMPEHSTREHVVAFHPLQKKMLYISNGTDFNNSTDVQNGMLGVLGSQSHSRRRDVEKNALLKAKKALNPRDTVLVSHSLGAQYTQYIASPADRVIQYNPFVTPGAKSRPNVSNYRTQHDVVSGFASAKTLPHTGTPLSAHSLSNIRHEAIFV